MPIRRFLLFVLLLLPAACASTSTDVTSTEADTAPLTFEQRFDKTEYRVQMRDGVALHTIVYAPRAAGDDRPILLFRTPYGIHPYGEGKYPGKLGPGPWFSDSDDYIYAYQDVRGSYMSEGEFVNMRPHLPDPPRDGVLINESTDTWDTIEYLLQHVGGHNGRVGMWGISYPGFYAAAGMIDAHPALKAVSPQAPIADWWYDDFHHHGALFLPHTVNFISSFGLHRPEPTADRRRRDWSHGTPDGYQFFLELGPLPNVNAKYLKDEVAFWNSAVAHPNYDSFWQQRDILPHLNDVAPAVMTVGGWFDAEDLYGPLQIYRSVEARNPDVYNVLVMGPWRHGGWARTDGSSLGHVSFGGAQSLYYREKLVRPFFDHFLRSSGAAVRPLAEATVFETGSNTWRTFDHWPPTRAVDAELFVHAGGALSVEPPPSGETADEAAFDSFVSDPARPVPYTEDTAIGMTRTYMTDDQRFASRRPDVLTFRTPPLEQDVTIAGPLMAELWV